MRRDHRRSVPRVAREGAVPSRDQHLEVTVCTSCAKGKWLGLGYILKAEPGDFLMKLVCCVIER